LDDIQNCIQSRVRIGTIRTLLTPLTLKQPAPNLGFAWNPGFNNGNLVIRGGGAISHYDEGWGPFEQATVFTNPGTQQKEFLTAEPPTRRPEVLERVVKTPGY
jgi:hypothetical protein